MSKWTTIIIWPHSRLRGIPLAFGMLLLILALVEAIEFWRLRTFHGSRLVKVLLTDQIMYFAAWVFLSFLSVCTDLMLAKGYNKLTFRDISRHKPDDDSLSSEPIRTSWKPDTLVHSWKPDVLQLERGRRGGCQWGNKCRLLSKSPNHQQHAFRRA